MNNNNQYNDENIDDELDDEADGPYADAIRRYRQRQTSIRAVMRLRLELTPDELGDWVFMRELLDHNVMHVYTAGEMTYSNVFDCFVNREAAWAHWHLRQDSSLDDPNNGVRRVEVIWHPRRHVVAFILAPLPNLTVHFPNRA